MNSKMDAIAVGGYLHRLVRGIPSVEDAVAAQKETGLPESYWWVKGWNFNRPLIARVNVSAHVLLGARVRVTMGDNCPEHGYLASEIEGCGLEFSGPILMPEGFNLANAKLSNPDAGQ